MVVSSRWRFQLKDGRAVVRQHLVGVLRLHRFGEAPGFVEIREGRLAPDEVRVRCVRERPLDRGLEARACHEEALGRAFTGEELAVALVDVARDEGGAEGVGAGDHHGGHAHDVGGEAGGRQRADVLLAGDEHLAAHVTALLLRRELVFPVHACGAGFDHRLHELERVERPTETGLRVGDDRHEPIAQRAAVVLGPFDLVGTAQRVVDAAHDGRHAVHGVEALVGVDLLGRGWRRRRPASPRGRSPGARP